MVDVRNLFKKCKACNKIWMKTFGCPNVTCGSGMNNKDFLIQKQVLKYNFKIENGRISYTTTDISKQ
jgi:hypothetical protein